MIELLFAGMSLFSLSDIDKQKDCMAKNIYHESRGESDRGMIAVAEVTMNRVKSNRFPDSVCEVVYSPYAFSWVGVIEEEPSLESVIDQESWKKANVIAQYAVTGMSPNYTKGSTHYHSDEVLPYWANEFDHVTTIGNHLFYKE